MNLGLDGRVAVVCGSTSGLGRASAEALADEGASVVVTGRRADLAIEIAAAMPSAIGVGCDLRSPDAVGTICTAATEAFGHVDILVLNGPGPRAGEAAHVDPEALRKDLGSLLFTPIEFVLALLPEMRYRSWGRILCLGSSGIVAPIAGLAASNTGRAGLAGYLKTLAAEVAGDGVTVNTVIPGRIATARVEELDARQASVEGISVAEVQAKWREAIPERRYGDVREIGSLVAFLSSERASYITGARIRCDGGLINAH